MITMAKQTIEKRVAKVSGYHRTIVQEVIRCYHEELLKDMLEDGSAKMPNFFLMQLKITNPKVLSHRFNEDSSYITDWAYIASLKSPKLIKEVLRDKIKETKAPAEDFLLENKIIDEELYQKIKEQMNNK